MLPSLNNLKLAHKLWLNQTIISFLVFVLAGVALVLFRENLLDDQREKTEHLVSTAHALVTHYADLAAAGQLPETEAKNAAREALRALRYGENGYFWVNDFGPTVVMHPFKPALEGKDVSGVKDPNGKALFVEFVKVAREQGGGFVDYHWPRGDGEEPLPKISFIKAYEPWGWILGTGIYVDDVDRTFLQWAGTALVALVFGTLLQLLFAAAIGRSITRPVGGLMRAMERVRKGGELSVRCKLERSDEVGAISQSFDYMMDGLQASVQESNAVAHQLAAASEQLTKVAGESKKLLDEKNLRTTQVATAMNEMSATVRDIAQNASGAAEASSKADQEAQGGTEVVRASVQGIGDLAAKIQRAADVIETLQSNVGAIEKVMEVIEGIAEQTNLLALNAAIEAARAGESGRGFAVVADEVRCLAQRTQASTAEIQQMIEGLLDGAQNAVSVMTDSQAKAQESVAQAQAAGTSFESIAQAIDRINDITAQIATASEEQSTVAEEINCNVHDIEDLSRRSLDGANHTAEASGELRASADKLLEAASRFAV